VPHLKRNPGCATDGNTISVSQRMITMDDIHDTASQIDHPRTLSKFKGLIAGLRSMKIKCVAVLFSNLVVTVHRSAIVRCGRYASKG